MAETTLKTRFLHAYKTEAQWKALTTVPKSGEILYTKTGERDGWYKVGNGTDLWKDLPYIKPSYDYSEIQPLMSKHYENVYVTANNDPNGYIYFGVVKPTDYHVPWRITYRVNAKINGVTDGYEYSEVTIDGSKDTYYSYRTYNVIPNYSYRPYYHHLLRYAKQAGQLNGYGHQLGLRFHSSYDPSNETHSRIIDIDIIELINCTFEFRDTMITYADVPGTGSTNYGDVSQFDAITNGQTISGDRNTYNQLYMSSDRIFAGPNHIFPYTLIMKTDDGRWESIVTSYNSNPVKERNTHGFRPQQLVYYSGGSTINENSLTGGSTFFVSHYAIDTRYSFNTHATAGNEHNLDINKPVYLVGTISPTDELFYLSDPWLSQDLPTEDDGKLYMYVGESINVYQASLHPTHPIYHFKDGKVRQYIIHEATQAVAGLMSATDKKKLDGIEAGANKYTLPVASSSAIGGVKSGGDITVGTDGSVTVNESVSLTTDKATSAGNRPVWVSYAGNNKRAAYDTDFTYDAVNNILHVQKIDGVELTGTPKAPTASAGTNSTQIATTAFVQNAVNNAVGDVEVGGRNLVKDSFRTISSTSYALADYYFGDRPPLEGETITIQIKGQLASTKSYFGIYNSGGSISPSRSAITAEDQDENGIYTKTFTWSVGYASNKYLRIYHMPSSVSDATSVIEWVKVERGTEPTDWTPAPEELVTSLSVSGRTITYKNYKGETLDSFTTQDTTYTAGTGITISGTTISNAYSEEKLKLSTELNTIALVDAFYETNYFKLGRATNYTTLTDITGRDGIVMSIPWVNTSYAQQVFFDIDDASKIYTRRKNSNGWGSWDRIVTESYGDSIYLPLSGGTLTQADNVFFTANAGDVLSPLPNSILNSPESKFAWHDVVAFNRVETPTFYTTTDGTTWTEADLNSEVFSMKQKWGHITAIDSTQAGVRWEWKKNLFSYGQIEWLVIEMIYTNKQAKFDVLLKAGTTTDGTTNYSSVLLDKKKISGTAFPLFLKITPSSAGSLQLTITKNSDSPADGLLGISGIHLLSNRNAAQGQGREYEYPYKWTGEKNIEFMNSIYPDTNEKYDLGTSTRYWNHIYGRAIYASTSSGEVQISVGHSTNQRLYLWGNISSGTRGLYDTKKGYIIQVSDTSATFHGSLNGNANTATTATTAETASFLKYNDSLDYANAGVSWFNISGTAGAELAVNDTPTTQWWHILRFNHTNTNENYTDLAIPFNHEHLYYKRISGGTVSNGRWVQLVDDLNYETVIGEKFLKLSGGTLTGDLLFSNSGTTTRKIQGTVGSSDYWRIAGGATASNSGWMEIATADDGNEPIYARQYSGTFTTAKNTAILLDTDGSTSFPVSVTAPNLQANSYIRAKDTIFNLVSDYTSINVDEIIIYTGLKWVASHYMPEIHITGNAYNSGCPIDLRLVFYIYGTKFCNMGVIDNGGWHPEVYLFKYAIDSVDYVAVGLKSSPHVYYPSIRVDFYNSSLIHLNDLTPSLAEIQFIKKDDPSVIPADDGGTTCILVPYKTVTNPIPKLTLQQNGGNTVIYDGTGTATFNVTKAGIGLSNVENKSSATIRGELTASNVTTALGYTPPAIINQNTTQNLSYLFNLGAYVGGSGAKKYVRITVPNQTIWNMTYLEVSLRTYNINHGGKVLIQASHNATSPYIWTQLSASVLGYLPDDIEVFASDGMYFYIYVNKAYSTASIDRMLIGDSSMNTNASGVTIDFVDTLPETYQTATMYYGLHSGNFTSYLTDTYIPYSGSTISNPNTSSFSLANGITGNLIFANTGNTAGDWKGIGGINGANDAWVLRGYQTANNKGAVELAVGDDGDEGIYVRQYTSAGYKIPLTNKPGANSGLNYREIELMAPSTGATTFPVSVKAPIIMAEEFRTANGGIPAVILCKPGLVSIADTKVDDPETNLTTSMDDDEWLKVLLKKICIEYPGKSHAIFKGVLSPNSQGYYEVYIYGTSTVNANTGLPQYAFGTWRHGPDIYWKFRTWGYTYSSQVILNDENYFTYALPLSGGTMTGTLTLKSNQYNDEGALSATAGTYALNLQNSNIIGVNAIFTSDVADDAREGINFYHTSTTVDSVWAKNGVLYFTPNRTLGTAGDTNNIILHSGNYMSYAVPYGGDDIGLGSGTPAEKAKEYFLDDSKVPKGTVKVFYNRSGSEFTTIFSKSSDGAYGNILKWGYGDLYLYKLRYSKGSWVGNDWQKIYAGYADSAGSATSSVKLSISSDLTTDTLDGFWENGYIKWARIRNYNIGLDSNDGLIINIPWDARYGAQLAIDESVTRMFMRNRSSNTWGAWHTFAHAQGKTGSTSQPVYMDSDGTLKVTTLTNSDISPIASKTYTGLYGSANDAANASFYFMSVKPNTYYVMWKIRYRIHCWVPGKNYYDSYSDVEIWGYQGSLSTNKIFNAHSYEGSSIRRCYYFHNLYRATQTGVSTYGHLIGLGLRASTNPTDSNYPRTFTIELLETENCECELWDEAVKYASVPGTGSTNYLGLSEINGADNGLQESSDANDTYTVRDYYTYLTAGANGMKQYSLVMEDDTGKWQSFTTTHGTATNKAKNTASFKLGNIYYMSTGSNYNSGQINGANIVTSHAMAIDFRYSTNCGTTLTANKPIFIVGTYNDATNTFTLDNTWWTQDYPTSEDNKIYIKIGYALNTYQIDFNNTLPMYWYKDGKVRVFVIHEATPVSGGLMSASDKEKLDVLNIAEAKMPVGKGKQVGWYRIAKIGMAANSAGAGYVNFTMYATGCYYSGAPSVGIFELTTMHNYATITQTSALLNAIITQIRLVGSAGEYYVDVYQNNAYTSEQSMGQQTFSFIGRGTIETYNPETPLTGDDADATAAATLEIKNKAMAAENVYATRMYGNTLIQCDGTILSGTNSTETNYTNITNGAIDVYGHTAQARLLVTHNNTAKSSLYLYANPNNTRGIYTTNSAGTGKTVIGIDDSNNITLYGNAETATNATTFTASVTVPTSRNYLLFQQDRSSNSGTVNARYHNSLSVTSNVSSSNSGTQWTELWIGNSTASGTAGNSQGWIGLYTSGSNTTQIAAYGTGNSNYFYIPNYAGSGYAVTAAGTSAVGSTTKPVYLAANGRVTALDHDVVSAFSYGSDIDANTFYDTGIYNITGGKLTNAPNNYGYGQILTMSYRKLSGNTTPDYASQIYIHHGGNNTNRMFYRTSSQTEWQDWQMVAHGAASTAVGDTNTPVYMTNIGVITAVNQPKSGAWFQGVPYVDGNGVIEIGKYIDFHATTGATTDYDVRLTATTTELTVSKMLKVSGQIHSNGDIYSNGQLYAGVSANNSTKPNGSIHVHDIRKYKVLPNDFDQGANFYFAITDSAVDVTMPTSGVWYSIMHIKGWTGDYSSWELAGPAHISDQRTTPLYVRAGRTTDDWGDWRKIYDESNPPAFTEIEGTLGVGKGGTGQTSAKNAANAFLNALDTGSSNPVDADYYISQYVGGGTTTTTYHRRPVSALYNYIKGKTDQVYIPLTGSSAVTGSISVRKASGEVQLAVGYTTEDTARWFYMFGNNVSGARGIYDSKKGTIVSVTDSSASFKGTADAITNFKVTTSTNLGIASVSTNAIGYVNGLAADDWNYQRTDGALYTQFYSSSWQHEIFGDYRTGQISLRGKNNGTWQAWRRVLDESNYSTIISDNYLQKGGGTITGMVYANADLTVGFSTSTEKSHVTFSNSFNNYELVNTVNGDFALHDNTASHYVWRYAKSSYTQTTNAEITGRLLVDCCLGPTDVIATGYIEAASNIVTDGGDLISGRTTNSTRASVLLQNNAASYRLCANTNGHCSLYAPDLGHNIFDFTPNGDSSYIDFPYTVKATVQARSDVRLKENIKDTKVNGLDAVNKMRLREYDWKADHKHQKVGLIADELEKVDEDLVSGGGYLDDGEMNAKCIDSYSLQMYMLKAIQELSQENKQLKEQLKTLMNRG